MKRMLIGFLKLLVLAILVLESGVLAPNSWRATGAEVGCIQKEREALLHFKAALGNDSAIYPWSSWGSQHHKRDCCKWDGVICSNQTGHVLMLHLPGPRSDWIQPYLPGKISSSLMELQYLTYFNLSFNHLLDSYIPEFLGSLTNLRQLDLQSCGLRGNISSQLGRLSHLQYLDLSGNDFEGTIPYQLGNLSQLQYLDLSNNNLEGVIPYQLGNLSNLQKLFLRGRVLFTLVLKTDQENSASGEWLSNLTSLTHLMLEGINLTCAHKWLQMIAKLPHLKELCLSSNELSDQDILSFPSLKFNSSSLSKFDLSRNRLMSSTIFHWLSNVSSNLVDLDLSFNQLEGLIPNEFSSIMTSLENLNLASNDLKGGLKSFRNICTLRSLSLVDNHLSEDLPTILQSLSRCAKYSLQYLDLSYNQITGTLLDLSIFTSLETFNIAENLLNGTIPKNFRFPSSLVYFDIHNNSLKGVLTNSHFDDMPNLKHLILFDNSLALRFSHNWVPPFQLQIIHVRSCKLGPGFPKWLQTQNNITQLDISNVGISGTIPELFWGLLTPKLTYLNASCNNLSGTVPDVPIRFTGDPVISLAFNHFEGPIPQFLHARALFLSNNNFSESHLFLCAKGTSEWMLALDLSNNQLFGQLPNCWGHFISLIFLDLSNNKLSGEFPASIGYLQGLEVLVLRNNKFTGELPITLKSCSELALLDVGENKFSGHIPSWIGIGLHQLDMLILRNNNFFGSLPVHLCYLSSIRFLDLSLNNLSGEIPKCFKNFTAMAQGVGSFLTGRYFLELHEGSLEIDVTLSLEALLMWKGTKRLFMKDLSITGIDLSSNHLVGGIPPELGVLVEMVSLNLSRNQLNGEIPSDIGQLASLDSLDLSRNHLFGLIPSNLAQIDRLAVLDLSYNNLSGKIPISTQLQSFDSSSYEGNIGLCGKPLEKKCLEDGKPQEPNKFLEDNHSIFSKEFYWSMTIGFIIGFWGIFGSILCNRSWRHAYFRFLNNLTDTIYVMVALNVRKYNRWLRDYREKRG